ARKQRKHRSRMQGGRAVILDGRWRPAYGPAELVVIWAGRLAATLNNSLNRPGTMRIPAEHMFRPGFLWPDPGEGSVEDTAIAMAHVESVSDRPATADRVREAAAPRDSLIARFGADTPLVLDAGI